MEWRRQSNVGEMYCAVHNVDCPIHDHSGDPWVLCVNPNRIPTSWMCPQAILEISRFADEAESKMEDNEGSPAGLTLTHHERQILDRCLRDEGWDEIRSALNRGEEFRTLVQIDGAQYALDQWEEDGEEVDALQTKLIEHWEDAR